MRRLALLAVGGALWLFAAAIPALADGGPHVASINNGSGGLTSDGCAGCHRAHTAQGALLLKEEGTALCESCHGAAVAGATTNVVNGVQYTLASDGSRSGTILGALRGGGFSTAAIGSSVGVRVYYLPTSGTTVTNRAKVPVRTDPTSGLISGTAVTSKHMSLTGTSSATVWGNGTSGAGTSLSLECTSCHNPHGNGQYRILKPMPGDGDGPFVEVTTGVAVTDADLPPQDTAGNFTDVRNYTVIQTHTGATTSSALPFTLGTYVNTSLLASQVTAPATAGDYLHRRVPWNGDTAANTTKAENDAPNGDPIYFNAQMNAWCATCHTRYTTSANPTGYGTLVRNGPTIAGIPNGSAIDYTTDAGAGSGPYDTSSGDPIFTYRHPTTSNKPCTTCHVSHGSNAQMTGFNSTHEAYPGAGSDPTVAANADSRLLKADNRGTCQLCHDPTSPTPPIGAGVVYPLGAAIPPTP